MTEEQRGAFLAELSELSVKHRIVIGGCGCCGSPWLDDLTADASRDEIFYRGLNGRYLGDGKLEWEEVK